MNKYKIIGMPTKKIIIDTDAGIDDALAIMLALGNDKFIDVLAILTVSGNTPTENSTRNVRHILQKTGKSTIPVYDGESRPLRPFREPIYADTFHGKSGLGFIELKGGPSLKEEGVSQLINLVKQHPNEITLVGLGPLTNIAKAIEKDPDTMKKVKEILFMGGNMGVPGNIMPAAEFNIYADPEAAKIVLEFEVPKVMIPIEPCNETYVEKSDFSRIKEGGFRDWVSQLMGNYLEVSLEYNKNVTIYDSLIMYYLVNPEAYEKKHLTVNVETKGEHTTGMTVIEQRNNRVPSGNTSVITKVNREDYLRDFFEALNRVGSSGETEFGAEKRNYKRKYDGGEFLC